MAAKKVSTKNVSLRTTPGKVFLAVVFLFIVLLMRVHLTVGAEPEAIYFVEGKDNMVALTFNVFWGEDNLEEIIDILKSKQTRATFFLTGEWIRTHPLPARNILQKGHEIGSHSNSLCRLNQLTREGIKEEFHGFDEAAKEVLYYKPKLFRPPYGEYNGFILKEARERDFLTIIWTVNVRNLLSIAGEAELMASIEKLQGGEIILFHGDIPNLPSIVSLFIDSLEKKGFQAVEVSTLLK